MDFVVAGLGFGALMVVIGFLVRDVGPFLWRQTGSISTDDTTEERGRWRALCHGISTALTAGGGLILLATVAAVLLGVTDSIGSLVVLVASIGGAGVAGTIIVKQSLAYRDGSISAAPEPVRRQSNAQPQQRRSSERSDSGEATTVQKMVKKPEPRAEAPKSVVTPQPPPPDPDEPFDATKLLPQEFDEEFAEPEPAAVTASSAADSANGAGDAAEQVDSQSQPAESVSQTSLGPPAPAGSEPAAAGADESTEQAPGSRTSNAAGAYQSPLLADIGANSSAAGGERSFSSRLLADVDTAEQEIPVNYQSPLLANLLLESGSKSTQEDSPSAASDASGSASKASEHGDADDPDTSADDEPVGSGARELA